MKMRHGTRRMHLAVSLLSSLFIGVTAGVGVALVFGAVALLRQPEASGDITDAVFILLYGGIWFGGVYGLAIGLVLALATLPLRGRPHLIKKWRLIWSIIAAALALALSFGLFTTEELASERYFIVSPVVVAGTLTWLLIPRLLVDD